LQHPKAGEFGKVFAVGVTPGVPIPIFVSQKDKQQQACNLVSSFFLQQLDYIGEDDGELYLWTFIISITLHLLVDIIPSRRLCFGTDAQFTFWNLAVASLATGSTVGRILDRRHAADR
jgi:hypothetical protein